MVEQNLQQKGKQRQWKTVKLDRWGDNWFIYPSHMGALKLNWKETVILKHI